MLLTGVFDPAPDALVIPWPYVGLLVIAASLATGGAVLATQAAASRRLTESPRDL